MIAANDLATRFMFELPSVANEPDAVAGRDLRVADQPAVDSQGEKGQREDERSVRPAKDCKSVGTTGGNAIHAGIAGHGSDRYGRVQNGAQRRASQFIPQSSVADSRSPP